MAKNPSGMGECIKGFMQCKFKKNVQDFAFNLSTGWRIDKFQQTSMNSNNYISNEFKVVIACAPGGLRRTPISYSFFIINYCENYGNLYNLILKLTQLSCYFKL